MASSPDDNMERSSTEEHAMQSSRDTPVADHRTPDPIYGRQTPKMDAAPEVEKYKLLNESPTWNIRLSPRKMNFRVYAPLLFSMRDMPDSETDHKTEPKVDVAHELASVKVPRIYSPVPYSRYNTAYSPVNWQKPVESSAPEERQADDHQIYDILRLEKKLLSETAKPSKETTKAAKQNTLRKRTKVSEPKTTTDKESIKYKDTKEIQELKKVYEAHLKEKEKLERLIEKRENELNEQLREMDEVMESKNEEVEAETKKKMEDFNSLRMIMTDKCITSDKKGDIVQEADGDAAFPRPSISKSPPLVSLNMISFEFKINITDTDNVSPDIGAPRNHNSTESGRLSKWVSEKNLAVFTETDTVKRNEHGKRLISGESQKRDHSTDGEVDDLKPTKINGDKTRECDVPVCEVEDKGLTTVHIIPEVSVSQMSAAKLERSHGVHERKSRIPKPLVRPYKSATKESERYKASEGHLIMAQMKNSQNKSEEFKDSKVCLTSDMLSKYSVKKNETAAKRCKKKEIQSKIDTGLKTRPSNVGANKSRKIIDDVAKIDKTVTRKDTVLVSFSPTPPPNATRYRKPSNRIQKLQSSRQNDNKQVSFERA